MTTLTTSADILRDVLFRAGEPIDGSSDFYVQAISQLNRAYRDIWTGGGAIVSGESEPWLWLKKDPPGVLILNPVISGTAAVVNNSTSVTLSAVQATSLVGRFFKVQSHPDVFRVSAHVGGTAAVTLDSVYTGPTTSGAYSAMQLEYSLATDVLRIIAPMRVYAQGKFEVDGVDLISLERDYPLAFVDTGAPDTFALVGEQKIRFNRSGGVSSTELMRLEYDYLQRPAVELADDTTQPLIPLEQRQVLADLALFYLLSDKSDLRAAEIGAQAKGGVMSMIKDNQNRRAQMSRTTGAIITRPTRTGPFMNRVLRTSSGLIIG